MHVLEAPCRRDTRKAPNVSPEALLFMAVIAAESVAAAEVVTRGTILDNAALRTCCLAGSAIGAVLAIAIETEGGKQKRQESGNELRALARKLLASAIGGVIFAPLMLRWFQMTLDPDIVLGWSGITAFASVSTLQIASGVYRRAAKKYLEDKATSIVGPLDEPQPPK